MLREVSGDWLTKGCLSSSTLNDSRNTPHAKSRALHVLQIASDFAKMQHLITSQCLVLCGSFTLLNIVLCTQGKSIHCGFDPENKESAAVEPQDQIYRGRSR